MARKKAGIHSRMIEVLKNYPRGLTFGQWRKALGLQPDEQGQLDRRKRDLYQRYIIERVRRGPDVIYIYKGRRKKPLDTGGISTRLRWELIQAAGGRCPNCGRTIERHGISLVIDHLIPRSWGGKTVRENLRAICEDCNHGKKNALRSLSQTVMRRIMRYRSVHQRLGELLKSSLRKAVPSYLLELVAGQTDWRKRTRELRYLGWRIAATRKTSQTGRVESFYTLKRYLAWPPDPTSWIRMYERRRARRNLRRRQ